MIESKLGYLNKIRLLSEQLVHEDPGCYTLAQKILHATFLRNYRQMAAIEALVTTTQDQLIGSSSMDLVRRSLEDYASIKYIFHKRTNQRANLFADYRHVERYQMMTYLIDVGAPRDASQDKEVDKEYHRVKDQFLIKNLKSSNHGKPRKLWAGEGRGVDWMLEYLFKNKLISKSRYKSYSQVYIWGSQTNHFSAEDILKTLDDNFNIKDDSTLETAVAMAGLLGIDFLVLYITKTPDNSAKYTQLEGELTAFIKHMAQADEGYSLCVVDTP